MELPQELDARSEDAEATRLSSGARSDRKELFLAFKLKGMRRAMAIA